jgi:hypothetical protein
MTERVLRFTPAPQDLLHTPNEPQLLTSQSTGQGSLLHSISLISCASEPQDFPPHFACRNTFREDKEVPPPHDLEQAPWIQPDMMQSRGSGIGVGEPVGAFVGSLVGADVVGI